MKWPICVRGMRRTSQLWPDDFSPEVYCFASLLRFRTVADPHPSSLMTVCAIARCRPSWGVHSVFLSLTPWNRKQLRRNCSWLFTVRSTVSSVFCCVSRLQFTLSRLPRRDSRSKICDGLNRINEFIHFFLVHHLWLLGGQCNERRPFYVTMVSLAMIRLNKMAPCSPQYVHVNKEHRCCEIVASEWDQVTI